MGIQVEQVEYHRNGVTGVGFNVVTFMADGAPMVGVVFPAAGEVAVFNREQLGQGDITFGSNSHRGDDYEAELRSAIAAQDGTAPAGVAGSPDDAYRW